MSAIIEVIRILLAEIGWNDIIDIIIVSYIFYKLLVFIRDSRAHLVFKGILVILGIYLTAYLLRLQMVSYIVDIILRNAALALVVVFQPEIRSVLERMGRMGGSRFSVSGLFSKDDDSEKRTETLNTISNVIECARMMQKQCMGALIVFEQDVKLDEQVSSGTMVDALPHARVLANIFFNKAPLHDGAVIIRHNRVCAAGCFLPLSSNNELDANFGTRHRAAIGMTENSDAVVLVVSEESGRISVAYNGEIKSSFDPADASAELIRLLLPDSGDSDAEKRFRLFGGKEKKEGNRE